MELWFWLALFTSFGSPVQICLDKWGLNKGISKHSVMLYTHITAAILFFFTAMNSDISYDTWIASVPLVIMAILVNLLGRFCHINALSKLSPGFLVSFTGMLPSFQAVFAYLYLGESIGIGHLICLILIIVGSFVFGKGKSSERRAGFLVGLLLLIAMMCLYSAGAGLGKEITLEGFLLPYLMLFHASMAFAVYIRSGGACLKVPSNLLALLCLSGAIMFLTHICFFEAAKLTKIVNVAGISKLSIINVVLIERYFLGVKHNKYEFAGLLIMLIGVVSLLI